jgi:hypothetical protein
MFKKGSELGWERSLEKMRWATLKEIAFYIMIAVLLMFMVLGFFHPITPQIP